MMQILTTFSKILKFFKYFFFHQAYDFVCVCVFACLGSCSDTNGSLVEMGGEDLGSALKKKKPIHVN